MKVRKSLSKVLIVFVLIAMVVGAFPLTTAAAAAPQTAAAATSAYNITGYLCNWVPWRASDIDAAKLTHINFAFANVSSSGQVIIGDAGVDPTYFNELKKLKDVNPNLKTLISVGGWTWSTNFHAAALTDASRTTFADSAVAFMKTHGFDGVDIDWEYPNQPGNGNPYGPEDKHNFTLLLQKLREKLDAQGIADGGKHYLLTIASGASQAYAQNVEFSQIQQYLDFINIMTYDFYGSWERKTGHASALMDPSGQNQFSVDSAVRIHMNNGVPANKIVVGCAFYGHSWSGVSNSNNGLYQSFSGSVNDEITYTQLISSYIDKNGYTRYWDSQAKAPYLWNGNTFVTYDDEQSLQEKAAYIKSKGLGGAMFWEYTQDFSGTLLTALWNNLNGGAETVSTPTFSPAAGNYTTAQSVDISCATADAIIRYTTDGTNPNSGSEVYSTPISIPVNATTTVKAVAYKSGMNDSAVASATYVIDDGSIVSTPTFSPAAGTYNSPQSIAISCATDGATIRYTTDGSTPTASSTAYTDPISVTADTTIKAIGMLSGKTDSAVASASYVITNEGTDRGTPTGAPATPSLTHDNWEGNTSYNLTMNIWWGNNATSWKIYENNNVIFSGPLDGNSPNGQTATYNVTGKANGTYSYKIELTNKFGTTSSNTISVTVTKGGTVEAAANPAFSPAGGTYNTAQSVVISCATAGATIRYTTNGSTPNADSPVYSAPISVTSGVVTVKAVASKSGMADSGVTSATYTITPADQVAAPTFNPAAGTYTAAQSITIACSTPDAVIRYTTDNSTPTSESTAYTGAISVAKTTTIKAIATKAGMADSTVVTSAYTIDDGTISPWAPNTAYKAGDKVSYEGKNYTCRQPHTSLPGWEPTNVPALWQQP